MRKIIAFFLVVFFISCKKDTPKIDVSAVKVSLELNRFDNDFYDNTKGLSELKKQYPFLFPTQVQDSVWSHKRVDKDELELYKETQNVYKNITALETELTDLFKHVKYYNNKFRSPKVITMLSNIDYESRVIYADSLLFISLDAYLGNTHEFYNDYPAYIKQNNTKEHIIVDVAQSIVDKQVLPENNRTFIDKMIYKGKKMFVLDTYLPAVANNEKIGYSKDKLAWAEANEEAIWRYFIEKDLLFSTDKNLDRRFLDLAPFSKFYMEEDNLSPGSIGVWVGWQIVKSYMKNNDVSLHQLLRTQEEEIFKKSKYKPRQ